MPASPNGFTRSDLPVSRTTVAIIVGLLLLASTGGLIWYLAYQAHERPPAQSPVANLQDAVTIRWAENGTSRIEARTLSDTYAALGYVHGLQRTWSMALWRQTALGQLGEWFGPGVLPLDRHARRLNLAKEAQSALAGLPASERDLLEAYASGVNAALKADAAKQHNELVLLNLNPPPWQPWHTLAMERLFGWLSTPPLPDSISASFRRADTRFRAWLHLHGFEHSTAWAVQKGDSTFLFQQHVFGTSALPLFEEVTIKRPNALPFLAASLPGTPFLPAGKQGSRAWALFLDSRTDLSLVDTASVSRTPTFHRLRSRSDNEELLRVERAPSGLPLPYPKADSMQLLLEWPGFDTTTDAPAWHALLEGTMPDDETSFQLLTGSGLQINNTGWHVLGQPETTEALPGGVFVGRSNWTRHQADVVQRRIRRSTSDLAAIGRSDSSTWAAHQMNRLLPLVQPLDGQNGPITDAVTYLRNWNYRYDPASIGASVLDTWLTRHGSSLAFPPPDSLIVRSVYRQSFKQAVRSLVARFGADARQWRWERVSPNQRYFPVWSADSLVDQNLSTLAQTRYAPVRRSTGHPSTPAGGASPLQSAPTPAAWSSWTPHQPQEPLTVHRLRLRPDVFMSRYTASDQPPPPIDLTPHMPARRTTRLVPASTSQ